MMPKKHLFKAACKDSLKKLFTSNTKVAQLVLTSSPLNMWKAVIRARRGKDASQHSLNQESSLLPAEIVQCSFQEHKPQGVWHNSAGSLKTVNQHWQHVI